MTASFPHPLERGAFPKRASAIFSTPGIVQRRASGAEAGLRNPFDDQSRSPAPQFPSANPSHGRDNGGTLTFRAVLHGYDRQGARFSLRCRGVAAENPNSCGRLDHWSFARLYAGKQSSRRFTQSLHSFLVIIIHVLNGNAGKFVCPTKEFPKTERVFPRAT